MWLDTLYWSVIGVIDVLAILFNAFLIYLALYRTPKMVRVYTTLIINLAFTDCCSAFLNFFVQQRMIPTAFTIGYISNGFCKYFGYRVCFFSHNLMAHFIVHSNYSLVLSFAYRYYILRKPEPQRKTVLIVLFLTYLPSFLQLILYQFAESEPLAIIALLQPYHPKYNFTGLTVSGVADIRSVYALYKILQMTVMTIPIFSTILYLRKKIIDKLLYRGVNISLNTKSLHSQLLMALTYQALLPTLYSINVVMYVLEQSGIYASPFFENFIMSGLVLIPFFSPFTSFFFFSPYKRIVLRILIRKLNKRQVAMSETGPGSFPI
ncbi:Serpentine Receptor, class D (Delta) [Caenorhabditis elegans]|uniref:Serpentine Receptor, class D (Delta) n=1 Tax=Caenorhabditis elegans TaxID=6239 RepID=Q9NAH9_CAEEL|nr:Serpentine Receptor, class D (Delta) [Caenorhabditis elegans]CAB76733.1 Serpentine Receptor, class D (Delta) [Caenorhabditis elegans]|eukprot:NP_502614.1 Serpentine Receptor, class D (delta) [Caenorhabditis elegans]